MRSRVVVLFAAVLLGALPGAANAAVVPSPVPRGRDLTLVEQGKLYGSHFRNELPPAGQTPEERTDWLLNQRAALGRTPMDWVAWAKEQGSVATGVATAPAAARPGDPDLTTAVLAVYSLVGVKPSLADRAAIAGAAAELSPNVRGALADLVTTVGAAYAAQVPVAKAVAARFDAAWNPTKDLLTIAERDATTARQAAILDALREFRARTAGELVGGTAGTRAATAPLFSDPEGLVVLGNTTDDTYERGGAVLDPVLLVDPAGNDTYRNSAGGACPVTPAIFGRWLECNSLVVSVVADLGDGTTAPSDDDYLYDGRPAAVQGAGGPGGLGVLVDVGGNDEYRAKMTRGDWSPFQPFTYYFDGGAQGYGYAGAGALLDGVGNDWYVFDVASTTGRSIWALGQGFGGAGGTGLAVDGDGSDWWVSRGLGNATYPANGSGFQGVYTQGTGFYGGLGISADLGADKDWWYGILKAESVDYYAQGFGAFGGVGILYEDGGDDVYKATETSNGTAAQSVITELLNCAFGTASYAGVGAMIDVAGNDNFYGMTSGPEGAFVMDWGWGGPGVAYGVYVDTGGNDIYKLEAFTGPGFTPEIEGWGLFRPEATHDNLFGTYVDIGGNDTYIGAHPSVGNDKVWTFGVDRA